MLQQAEFQRFWLLREIRVSSWIFICTNFLCSNPVWCGVTSIWKNSQIWLATFSTSTRKFPLFAPYTIPFLPVFTPYIPKHAPCRTFVRLRHSSYEPSSPLFSSFPKAPKKHLFRSQFSNAFISTVFYRAKIDPVCFYFAKIEVCNRIYAQELFLFLSLDGFRLPSTV